MNEFSFKLFLIMIGKGLFVGIIFGSVVWFLKVVPIIRRADVKRIRLINIVILTTLIGIIFCLLFYGYLLDTYTIELYIDLIISTISVTCSVLLVWIFLRLSYGKKHNNLDNNIENNIYKIFPMFDAIFCIIIVCFFSPLFFYGMITDLPRDWVIILDAHLSEYIGILMSTIIGGLTSALHSP